MTDSICAIFLLIAVLSIIISKRNTSFFCSQSFFGRTYNNLSSISECKNNGECVINKKNRTSCKACRLRKCLLVGMSKSGSRYGRRSNWFKIHCLLQDQNAAAAAAAVGHHQPHHHHQHHNGSNRSSPHHQQPQPPHHQSQPSPFGSPLYPAGLVHPGHHFLTTDKFLQARLNGYGAAAALMTAAAQDDASCRRQAAADAIISGHHHHHHRNRHHHNNNNNSIDRRHRHRYDDEDDDDDDCGGRRRRRDGDDDDDDDDDNGERNDNNNGSDDHSPKGGHRRRRRPSASDDSGGSSMPDDEDNRGSSRRKTASPVLRHHHRSPSCTTGGTPPAFRQLSSSPSASSTGSGDAKRIRLSVSPSSATVGLSPVSGFHSPYYPMSVTRPGLTPFVGGGLTLSMAAAGWHAAVAAGRTAAGGDLLLSSPAPGGVAIEQEYPIDLSLKTTAAKYNRSPLPHAPQSAGGRHSSTDDPETAATATTLPPSPLDLTKRTAEV